MKNLDIKSFAIGALLGSIFFLSIGAASKADLGKWDEKQEWLIVSRDNLQKANLLKGISTKQGNGKMLYHFKATPGWEPFGANDLYFRKRVK